VRLPAELHRRLGLLAADEDRARTPWSRWPSPSTWTLSGFGWSWSASARMPTTE